MVNILNFKKKEIVVENKEAAKEWAVENFGHYSGDATQAYNRWKEKQTGEITERSIKEFMLDYLNHKTKNCPGSSFLICIDPAISDTRNRPYRVENVPNEGKRKRKATYVATDVKTGTIIGKWRTHKADALNGIKDLYKSGEYKGDCKLEKTWEVVEGNSVVAKCYYTPSKNTKNGTWLVFGITNE